MQTKSILLRWCAMISMIALYVSIIIFLEPHSALSGYFGKYPTHPEKTKVIQPVISTYKTQTTPGLPHRLSIPRIHINITLEHVWLTSVWAMETPKNPDNGGWFRLGFRPGEIGTAVIDGHSGVWKNGKISVFNNLQKLRTGDTLSIEDENGAHMTFVVKTTHIYDQYAPTGEIFTSKDGKVHLNLITCQGAWNALTKSYPKRLVVFSERVE